MDSKHDSPSESVLRLTNRRQFLWLAAGTTLGIVVLQVTPVWASDGPAPDDFQPSDTPPDFVAGTVISLASGGLALQPKQGQPLLVEHSPSARLYSGIYGRVTSLREFIIGDLIGVQGFRTSSHFVAKRAGSIFRPLEVTIGSVDPERDVAASDVGVLDLSHMNLPDVGRVGIPRSLISAGQRLDALTWTHPATSTTYLAAATVA